MAPLKNPGPLHANDSVPRLLEKALERKEGRFSQDGAFVVSTGRHTGRSAQDKFLVRDEASESHIWWDNNKSITKEQFAQLDADMHAHMEGKEMFVQDVYAGWDPAHRLAVRIYSRRAWHALFVRSLLEPAGLPAGAPAGKPAGGGEFTPQATIIDCADMKADPKRHGSSGDTIIALDMENKQVRIAGTAYAGEMKKSVFSLLNYMLPPRGVLPMHCSVNVGKQGDSAIFFGLSGTGKTTLSADPRRALVGDDEHGWSADGLFNFEAGCYAKMIRLSAEAEPDIYAAVHRFGAVLENVVMEESTGRLDLDDDSITENTRGAYPLTFIASAHPGGRAPHPNNIFMLTADAFGVLPPVARLTPEQAMYHFLSGYTAKLAGTEQGVTTPQATFSACFGAPFMPRPPGVYGQMLRDRMAEHGCACWLVNTGWTGGPFGVGHRMPIACTRAILDAALTGALVQVPMREDPLFGFQVPTQVPGVDTSLLVPRDTWGSPQDCDRQAQDLAGRFRTNFEALAVEGAEALTAAGPRAA